MMLAVLDNLYVSEIKYRYFGYTIDSIKLVANSNEAILFRKENEDLKELGAVFVKYKSEDAG